MGWAWAAKPHVLLSTAGRSFSLIKPGSWLLALPSLCSLLAQPPPSHPQPLTVTPPLPMSPALQHAVQRAGRLDVRLLQSGPCEGPHYRHPPHAVAP